MTFCTDISIAMVKANRWVFSYVDFLLSLFYQFGARIAKRRVFVGWYLGPPHSEEVVSQLAGAEENPVSVKELTKMLHSVLY